MTLSHISRNVSTPDPPASSPAADARLAKLEPTQAAVMTAQKQQQQQQLQQQAQQKQEDGEEGRKCEAAAAMTAGVVEPRTLSPASYTAAALQGKRLPPSRQRHTSMTANATSVSAMLPQASFTTMTSDTTTTTTPGAAAASSSSSMPVAGRVQGTRIGTSASHTASSSALPRPPGLVQTQLCIDLPPSFTRSAYTPLLEEEEEEEEEEDKGKSSPAQRRQQQSTPSHSPQVTRTTGGGGGGKEEGSGGQDECAAGAVACIASQNTDAAHNTCTNTASRSTGGSARNAQARQGGNANPTTRTRTAANFASGVMLWRPTQLLQPVLSSRAASFAANNNNNYSSSSSNNNGNVSRTSSARPRYADHFAAVEVLPGLYLGTKADATSLEELQRRHISLVINVSEDCPVSTALCRNPHRIRIVQFPLKDHSDEAINAYFIPVTTIIHAQLHRRKAYLQSRGLDDTMPQGVAATATATSTTSSNEGGMNTNRYHVTSEAASAPLAPPSQELDLASPTLVRQWSDVIFAQPPEAASRTTPVTTNSTSEVVAGVAGSNAPCEAHDRVTPLPSGSTVMTTMTTMLMQQQSSASSQTSASALVDPIITPTTDGNGSLRPTAENNDNDNNNSSKKKEAVPLVVDVRDCGGVLVHCRMGVSRSASLVLAYLILYGTVLASLERPSRLFRHWLRRERRLVEQAGGRVCVSGGGGGSGGGGDCLSDEADGPVAGGRASMHTVTSTAVQDEEGDEVVGLGGSVTTPTSDSTAKNNYATSASSSSSTTGRAARTQRAATKTTTTSSSASQCSVMMCGQSAPRRSPGSRPAAQETPLSSATTTRTGAGTRPGGHTRCSLHGSAHSPVTPRRYAAHSCPACLQLRQSLARRPPHPSLHRSGRRGSARLAPAGTSGPAAERPSASLTTLTTTTTSTTNTHTTTPLQASMSLTDLRRTPGSTLLRGSGGRNSINMNNVIAAASGTACRAELRRVRRGNLLLPYRALHLNCPRSTASCDATSSVQGSPQLLTQPHVQAQPYNSPLYMRRTPTSTQDAMLSVDPTRLSRRQSTVHFDFASRGGPGNGRASSTMSSPLECSTAGMTYREAFEFLKRKKSDINPNIGFVLALRELAAGSDFSLSTSFGDRT